MASSRRHWPRSVVVALTLRQDGVCGARWNSGGCGESLSVPAIEDQDAYVGVDLDHIVPLEDGGADTLRNLQLLHEHCHAAKTGSENSDRAGRVL